MVTHSEFLAFIQFLLGKKPHMGSREELANLIRSKGFTFLFQWTWMVKNCGDIMKQVDGVKMDVGFCNDDMIRIYVPEEARK
jgi:hypothetical protein